MALTAAEADPASPAARADHTMPVPHIVAGGVLAILWGVNFVAIDIGLRTFPPLLFVALRFALAAVPAVFFVPRPKVPLRYVIGIGTLLSGSTQGLLFVSIHEGMPAGLSSLVIQSQAIFTVGLAALLLGERPARRQLVGGAVAAAGIALIGVDRVGGTVPLFALLLCVVAALTWGFGNLVVRAARPPDVISMVVWSSLIPPLPLLGLSLWLEGPHRIGHALSTAPPGAIESLLFVVVVATVIGSGVWTWLLRLHPASKVAPFTLLVPVFGIGSAWAWLGQRPGTIELVGGAVVLVGLSLVTFSLRRPGAGAPPRGTGAGAPAAARGGSGTGTGAAR